jgi:hypothetical protein
MQIFSRVSTAVNGAVRSWLENCQVKIYRQKKANIFLLDKTKFLNCSFFFLSITALVTIGITEEELTFQVC